CLLQLPANGRGIADPDSGAVSEFTYLLAARRGLHHPTSIALGDSRLRVVSIARNWLSSQVRYAVHQTTQGVLQVVSILHNLVFIIAPVEPPFLHILRQRGEYLQAPRIHSLRHIQDSRLDRAVYGLQWNAKIEIGL